MSNLNKVVKKTVPQSIVIETARRSEVFLEVAGVTPLIQNNFSQKSLEQMLRKHMGLTVEQERKKPRDVIEAAKILNEDGRVCVAPTAFKKGMISAAGTIKAKGALRPHQLKSQLFVVGESVPITFDRCEARMDIVRTSGMNRVPDIRFRPSFIGWKARFGILYADGVNVQTVLDLVQRAGKIGVGEWRPEKNGTFGTYEVSRSITASKEIAEIQQECAVPLKRLSIPEWALDAEIDPLLVLQYAAEQGQADEEEESHGHRNGKSADVGGLV